MDTSTKLANVADLKKKRGYVRTSLTKSFTKLASWLQADDIDEINAGYAVCSSVWDEAHSYDKKIFDILVEIGSSDVELDQESESCLVYLHKLQSMKQKVEKKTKGMGSGNTQNQKKESTGNTSIRLPKINLPTFEGDILIFDSFWDSFSNAVADTNLSNCQKLTYLKSCLKGDALKLIDDLPNTDDAYSSAVDILHRAYKNSLLVLLTLMESFHKLSLDTSKYESVMKFRAGYESVIGRLVKMGYTVEGNNTAETLLVSCIILKLPDFIRSNLQRSLGEDILSLNRFREGMQTELDILAGKLLCKSKNDVKVSLKNSKPVYSNDTSVSEPPMQGSALTLNVTDSELKSAPRSPFCHFCQTVGHSSTRCNVYDTVDARKRRLIAMKTRCGTCFLKKT